MHDNIYRKVESYLDGKLGRWTRLLPWRHELSDHLQQEYENKLTTTDDQESAWKNALKEFGDIDEVSTELKRLHKPENICVRLIAVLISFGLVAWSSRCIMAFVHIPSAMLLIAPLVIGVCSLLFSRGLKLKEISRYCNFALCAGAITGVGLAASNLRSPSCIGMGTATTLLCGLYAILFLDVSIKYLYFYITVNIAVMMAVLYSFYPYYSISINFQNVYVKEFIAIAIAGLLAGWARWGLKRLPQYVLQIAVGVMAVYQINMLQDLSYPEDVLGNIMVSLLPVIIFPLLGKILERCFTVSIQQ